MQVSGTAIKKPFSKIKWQNRSLSLANFLPPAVIEKFLKSEKSLITDIKYIFDCVYSNLSFLFNRYSSSSSLRDDFPPPSPSPSLLHLPYSPPSSSPDASLSSSLSHLHSRVLSVFHILSTIINVFNQFGASSSVSSNNLMSSSPSSSSSATSNTPLSHVQSYNKIFSLLSAPLLHSIDSSSNAILVCISYFSSPFPPRFPFSPLFSIYYSPPSPSFILPFSSPFPLPPFLLLLFLSFVSSFLFSSPSPLFSIYYSPRSPLPSLPPFLPNLLFPSFSSLVSSLPVPAPVSLTLLILTPRPLLFPLPFPFPFASPLSIYLYPLLSSQY